jgi:hypothetical protein
MTKKEGLTYDDGLKQFLKNNPTETVEVIRCKRNLPRRHKVKYIPYIELEDYIESSYGEDIQPKYIQPKPEIKSEEEEEFDENELASYMQDTPFPPKLQELKWVLFNDNPQCYWLPLDNTLKSQLKIPSLPTGKPSLLKQTIDGTATFLFGQVPDNGGGPKPTGQARPATGNRDRPASPTFVDGARG